MTLVEASSTLFIKGKVLCHAREVKASGKSFIYKVFLIKKLSMFYAKIIYQFLDHFEVI